MRLERLEIQGLGRYGPETTTWQLDGKSSVIVGPANAGKSTLATAAWRAIHGQTPPESFYGPRPAAMTVSMSLQLSPADSLEIAEQVFGRHQPAAPEVSKDLWSWLGATLFPTIAFQYTSRLDVHGPSGHTQVFRGRFWQDVVSNVMTFRTKGHQIDWPQFLELADRVHSIPGSSQSRLLQSLSSAAVHSVVLSTTFDDVALQLLKSRIQLLSEVRPRPRNLMPDADETWDGLALGGVLGAMSSGSQAQRDEYAAIKQTFEGLVPLMKLFPWRPDNDWELGFVVPGVENPLPPSAVGMGTLGTLLQVTNLLSSKGRVIILEEPELYLHPTAQRALQRVINKATMDNQVLVVSHSRDVVPGDRGFRILRLEPGPQPDRIETQDPSSLSAIQPNWVREYLKDALFARCVLLVEGPYDQLTIQNLLDVLLADWRARGVVVVPVDGKKNVMKPLEFLSGLGLNVMVCLDSDALSNTDSAIRRDNGRSPASAALAQAIQLGLIGDEDAASIATVGEATGSAAEFPSEFVDEWRDKLGTLGWVVLTDTLDSLILRATSSKDSVGGRRAEEASRTIASADIPDELTQLVDRLRVATDQPQQSIID